MVPEGKDRRAREADQGWEGRSRAGVVLLAREENILTLPTYLTVIPQLAAPFIHTDSPTNLPTYLLTNLPTNLRVRSPPRPSVAPSDCSLTLTYLLILTPPTASHAYSPPRGDSTSTPLEILIPELYTLMRATDNWTDITWRRTIPPCKSRSDPPVKTRLCSRRDLHQTPRVFHFNI